MRTLLILFLFFSFQNSYSQKTIYPKSIIKEVIVYEKGAMITRTIELEKLNNITEIVIDSLPKDITPKSLQANASEGLKILSVKYENLEEESLEIDAYNEMKFTLTSLEDSIKYQQMILSSIESEIELIKKNNNFNTESGVNIESLTKATKLYKTQLRALQKEKFGINKVVNKLKDTIHKLQLSILALDTQPFYNHRAIIKVENKGAINPKMELKYYSPNASWYSFYDLRISGTDQKENLDHKAYVSQNTGEDWTDVRLTLSNRKPNKSVIQKKITPYILQNNNVPIQDSYSHNNQKDFIHGTIRDENNEPLIGANIVFENSTIGTITDIDGKFKIHNPYNQKFLVCSYTGYQPKTIDVTNTSYIDIYLHEEVLLDEIIVVGSLQGKVAGIEMNSTEMKEKKQTRKAIFIKEQKSLNLKSFAIDQKYSIPSDAEEYDVLLRNVEMPVEYYHSIFPSVEPIAYLNVGIPDWKTYNLFSGKVNLYLEGQYTGVSQLDIDEVRDTIWFSLGEDSGISIDRKPLKEYNKDYFFKNKKKELHAFEILISNNKTSSCSITITDQIPVSRNSDVKVKVIEKSDAKLEKHSGYLLWKTKLAPGQKDNFVVKYEIKYNNNVEIFSQ